MIHLIYSGGNNDNLNGFQISKNQGNHNQYTVRVPSVIIEEVGADGDVAYKVMDKLNIPAI